MPRPVKSLAVKGVQFLCNVIAHNQGKDLGYVAMLSKKQIEFLPPPRHISAGVISTEGNLWRIKQRTNDNKELKGNGDTSSLLLLGYNLVFAHNQIAENR